MNVCQTANKMVMILSGKQRELAHQLIIQSDMVALVGPQLLAEVYLSVLLRRISVTVC